VGGGSAAACRRMCPPPKRRAPTPAKPAGLMPILTLAIRPSEVWLTRGPARFRYRNHGSAGRRDRRLSNRPAAHAQPRRASRVLARLVHRRQPQRHAPFLGLDDQFGAPDLAAQSSVVALRLVDLSHRRIRLRSALFRRGRRLIRRTEQVAPACDDGGVDALAPQERAERTCRFATCGPGEQPALLTSARGERRSVRWLT
jgi:hypothetical protein